MHRLRGVRVRGGAGLRHPALLAAAL